jgi:hypothetical protein
MFLVKKLTKKSESSSKPSSTAPTQASFPPPRTIPTPAPVAAVAVAAVDIFESCKRGDLGEVESYLNEGGDLEKKNKVRFLLFLLFLQLFVVRRNSSHAGLVLWPT